LVTNPVIIISPPRSGSSFVARIVNEYFGVCLYRTTHGKTHVWPRGSFEDVKLHQACKELINSVCTLEDHYNFNMEYTEFIKTMSKHKKWGFKEPLLCFKMKEIVESFDNPTLIRCWRDKKTTVQSMHDRLGWSLEDADKRYDSDDNSINEALKGKKHCFIDLSNRISGTQILTKLNRYLQ